MHNASTSMEGLTSLTFYRDVSHLIGDAWPILRSSTGSDRIRQSVHPPVLRIRRVGECPVPPRSL
jgi:hypothetical protein